jgi:hypothetical protein
MENIEINTAATEYAAIDGATVVVVGGTADTAVLVTPTANPALAVTGDAGVVVVAAGGTTNSGPGIDLSAAQEGDVIEVADGALVPTHQQKNQIYDGGNF